MISSLCFVPGCAFVLQWLQQEYWSRQLGSRLAEDWDSESEEEEDDESWARRREEELLNRQKEIENHSEWSSIFLSIVSVHDVFSCC